MPLLDHFHPPLSERRHWEAFHARWASAIADDLNDNVLPENLFAEPTVHVGGQVHVDDSFEVQVIDTEGAPKLVAAIELVSPSNKDRPQTRRAFAVKCANYLCQGIPFIIIDVVTMNLMETADFRLPPEAALYGTSYRPVQREGRAEIDAWNERIDVGGVLPSLPLYIGTERPLAIDFEASYQETCRRLRLVA
jgi:hypothetical protein